MCQLAELLAGEVEEALGVLLQSRTTNYRPSDKPTSPLTFSNIRNLVEEYQTLAAAAYLMQKAGVNFESELSSWFPATLETLDVGRHSEKVRFPGSEYRGLSQVTMHCAQALPGGSHGGRADGGFM